MQPKGMGALQVPRPWWCAAELAIPWVDKYVACINDGVNKCCEVFYQKCKAGTKWKILLWDHVEPKCPDDPEFDPYR